MLSKKTICAFLLTAVGASLFATQAQAGPLLDWLTGRYRRCYSPPTPTCGLQPGQCQTTCQQTCTRTVVNYVPCTSYRTDWQRVPVTQYRPVTSSDPCTGCTVTCMKPCTTYTWQQRRIPYTTYRPVYRQETYRVPVSYVTQAAPSCNTCTPTFSGFLPRSTVAPATLGCPSCVSSNSATTPMTSLPAATITPNGTYTATPAPTYYQQPTPAAINTPSAPQSPTPADAQPRLKPALPDGSVIERREITDNSSFPVPQLSPSLEGVKPLKDPNPGLRWDENTAPALIESGDKVAMTPVRQKFDYSPIRLASYESEVDTPQKNETNEFHAEVEIDSEKPEAKVNSMWKSQPW